MLAVFLIYRKTLGNVQSPSQTSVNFIFTKHPQILVFHGRNVNRGKKLKEITSFVKVQHEGLLEGWGEGKREGGGSGRGKERRGGPYCFLGVEIRPSGFLLNRRELLAHS